MVRRLTAPIPSILCAQEEVLNDDNDEVPQNDLSPEDRLVEGWDFPGYLPVVIRQAEENKQTDTPQDYGDG